MPERFSLVPAVYLFLERDGRVLLMRRRNTGFADGSYAAIAGHMAVIKTAATNTFVFGLVGTVDASIGTAAGCHHAARRGGVFMSAAHRRDRKIHTSV